MSYALTWDDSKRRGRLIGAFALLFAAALWAPRPLASLADAASALSPVIVRATPNAGGAAEQSVRDLGGRVDRRIGIINGFSADVPENRVEQLRREPGVGSVTRNSRVRLLGGYDPTADPSSMYTDTKRAGLQQMWMSGATGRGVDVALIDSGVAAVDGLAVPGKVLYGPDLSFDSQQPSTANIDTFGHGTHMAGIIAGRDDGADPNHYWDDPGHFLGVAPDARLVSIKVADSLGNTDVSQIIAAIDWVVQHRSDNGLNIRVLNLSFGTTPGQPYDVDPLAYAAEVAWRSGIVVVAAAGNAGNNSASLTDPAYDPYVLAVGAAVPVDIDSMRADTVARFSSGGSDSRTPDIVAPGAHLQSLRAPGSFIDSTYAATGQVNSRFFRGSGTSQATAFASGEAALLVSKMPWLSPDEVKATLMGAARRLHRSSSRLQGAGEVSFASPPPGEEDGRSGLDPRRGVQSWRQSTGVGPLELSRGGLHVTMGGVPLTGEHDIFAHPWDSASIAALEARASSWAGGTWNGSTWTGSTWTGSTWTGSTWTSLSWAGSTWTGSTWTGSTWTGSTWTGSTWTGSTWTGSTWTSSDWSAAGASGDGFSGQWE
jgi:serine protease AprX